MSFVAYFVFAGLLSSVICRAAQPDFDTVSGDPEFGNDELGRILARE